MHSLSTLFLECSFGFFLTFQNSCHFLYCLILLHSNTFTRVHRYVYQFPLPSLLHECDPEVRVGYPMTPRGISLSSCWYLYPSAEGPRGRSWHVFICIGYTLKVVLLFSDVLFKHWWSLSVDQSRHRYFLVKWSIFRRRKTFLFLFEQNIDGDALLRYLTT